MKRSQLRKVFLQRKHSIVKLHIVNKRTTVPASSCKKNETFENIGTSNISDNKLFWKTVQPMFSNKSVNRESITLVKGDKISSENLEVAETFNAFFSNIVKKMNISLGQELLIEADHIEDPVPRIMERLKKHPSVGAIFENHKDSAFSFRHVSLDEITKEIKGLAVKRKACQDTDIPTKVIKNNSDIFADFFFLNLNNCITSSVFPSNLKNAEITPVHKKDSKNTESNYRPVSILSNISKIYEKCIFFQISNYFEKILARYRFGFRKGHNTQQCLLVMIEKRRQSLDKGGNYGALLTDLSKAFDYLSHDLLIAKLHAYGFDIPTLRLLHNYLINRNQRVKIDSAFSSWEEILFDVPQGSVLGPLLFNIFYVIYFFS